MFHGNILTIKERFHCEIALFIDKYKISLPIKIQPLGKGILYPRVVYG